MGRVTPVTESVPCGTILTQINMAAEVRQYAQCMRTPAKILKHDEEYSFSADYFRCGKCSIEFCVMEEFVLHKLFVEHCSLMMCASERIEGLLIPKFVEHATDAQLTKPKTEIKGSEQETCAESAVASTTDINYDMDPQVDDLLTFKQNKRNTKTNSKTPKQKQSHSQGQQASNTFSADNDVDHNTETEARSETDEPRNNKKSTLYTVTGSKSVVCDQCGNRYKDMAVLRTHISTVHSVTCPYHCQQCPDAFKTKGSLVRHIRRHTGERPFHCQYCGRSFRESGALTRHLKSRVSCLTKTDTDLPRYGKTETLQENESEVKEKIPSTLQIIISRVSETHCNTKTDEEEDHCSTEEIHAHEHTVVDHDNNYR